MPSQPKPPKPQDPDAVAAAQQKVNVAQTTGTQTAQQTNQQTPFGSITYTPTGFVDSTGIQQFLANTQLSPQQQQILNNLQQSQMGLGGAGGNMVNASFDQYSTPPDFSEAAGTQTKLNMDRQLGYLTPYFTQQNEQLDNQLRNQGLMPGTQAYDRAMRSMQDNQNQSVMSFLNQTQPIAFQQAQAQYNQPLQTVSNIMGLTQPASLPQNLVGTPKPGMAGTDYVGANTAYNQAAFNQYQAQQAQYNAMLQGVAGIGSTMAPLLLGISDERVKDNITPVGKTYDGQNIYRFNYKGDTTTQMGLLAQEVEKTKPEAVYEIDGLKVVDYGAATDDTIRGIMGL